MFTFVSITNCQRCFTILHKRGEEVTMRKVHFCKSIRAAKAYAGFCRDEQEIVEVFDEHKVRVAHKCIVNGKQKWLAN